MHTPRTPRVVAARKLLTHRGRAEARRFLAEGPQAVREALCAQAAIELFVTPETLDRHAELTRAAESAGVRCSRVRADALASLTETVHPQGIVAVCRHRDVGLELALASRPRLVAVLVDIRDPGNAGTVLRTADAAGAGSVVFVGDSVDPYNGKCVRASAGSVFHLDLVIAADPFVVVSALRHAGLRTSAAHLRDAENLDLVAARGDLAAPTAWLFGSEAHGLPTAVAKAADSRVMVPIHGRAESLNLAAAAAVCLYTSARAQCGTPARDGSTEADR
ncbi:MAG: RNA methyltransferase [Micromonosporaceae bacterium]|nr:RNA methyltransferase [Micromonosporaceae bacterium]